MYLCPVFEGAKINALVPKMHHLNFKRFNFQTVAIKSQAISCTNVDQNYGHVVVPLLGELIYQSLSQERKWPWRRHQVETFSALLALCVGNSLVTGEFPSQRLVTRSFDVFFDLCLNKRLSKQSRRWRFEMPSLWRLVMRWVGNLKFACGLTIL